MSNDDRRPLVQDDPPPERPNDRKPLDDPPPGRPDDVPPEVDITEWP